MSAHFISFIEPNTSQSGDDGIGILNGCLWYAFVLSPKVSQTNPIFICISKIIRYDDLVPV
jgi:hypothetical protein